MSRENSRKSWSFFAILFLSTVQFLKCEDFSYMDGEQNCTKMSSYARIKHLLPQPSQNEAAFWRLNDNDDDYENHPCKRECVANQPMTCYYYMVVHNDETMGSECAQYLNPAYRLLNGDHEMYALPHSVRMQDTIKNCKFADGVKTEIMIVNDQLIGLAIEMCEGDTVVADVINSMQETTTIHWHGIHQRKTPHMDGVPHVTQYPIQPGQAFRYRFEVDHAGTNWWHSHTEHQRAFGLAGVFIVRQPKSDNVHELLYDFDLVEHTMMLQDWMHHYDGTTPRNLLINGLGRNVHRNEPGVLKIATVYENFDVVQGARYRFRAIFNGISNCPIGLSIDQHDLVVIASDGNDIEPVTVQKIIFHSAERFDFIVHANQAVDNYWIRIKGYNFCQPDELHQEAILHYKGASLNSKPNGIISYSYEPTGIVLNPIDEGPGDNLNGITITETVALERRMEPPMTPYRTYYTSMSVYVRNNEFHFQMDDITFTFPKVSLLQTRNLGIGGMFCNKTTLAARGINCREATCQCPNVIEVPAFKFVEFVISSNTASAHPIHLHGYTFRVVGMGVLGESRIDQIEEIDKRTPLPRRKRGAPLKDSVQVPAFGYTIIRFYTDSPGYWILHCHISTHSEQGMAAVLKVGDDAQMKLCPVSNCGLCGSMF